MAKTAKKKQPWPAETIERRKVVDLVPYARNARLHDKAQVAQIAASIKEWGWTNPILIDEDGGLIAGHGRLLAAQQLGIDEVPCMVAHGWTKAQRQAYVIADNQLALQADWDTDLLGGELGELSGMGFDLGLIGFDDKSLGLLLSSSDEIVEDELPAVAKEAVSKTGQLWALGDHRVLCGDNANIPDWDVEAIVSDPPYGIDYRGMTGEGVSQRGMSPDQRRKVRPIVGDDRPFDPRWILDKYSGDVLLWGADFYYDKLPSNGSWIVWDKRSSEAADAIPGSPFEMCWSRRKQKRRFIRVPWGGWNSTEAGETERWHTTQKPIAVMAEVIKAAKGDVILDPFLGSGTTLMACEQLGRRCYGIEIEPLYVDVTIKRWENFTGRKAKLLHDSKEAKRAKAPA